MRADRDREAAQIGRTGAVGRVAGLRVLVPEVRCGVREFDGEPLVVGAQGVIGGERSPCTTVTGERWPVAARWSSIDSIGVQPIPAEAGSSGASTASRTRSP